MELRQLRYFLAVAEARHFTRAAEALGISQSTLSTQVRELERDLGAPLFDRTGREVRLTVAGAAFLGPAGRTVREAAAGRDAVAEALGTVAGTIRLGVTHVFSTRLVPRIVATCAARHPQVRLEITKVGGLGVRYGVMAGQFDLGISYSTRQSPEIEKEPIFEDELVAVVPPGHALAARGAVRLADLAGQPLALPDRECSTRRVLDRTLARLDVRPQVVVAINDTHAILQIVRLGAYATVLARGCLTDGHGLEVVALTEPAIRLPACLFWRRDAHRSPVALAIRQIILDAESAWLTGPDGTGRPERPA